MLGRLVYLQIGMVAALRADDMQAPLLQNAEEQPAVDDPIDPAFGHENVEADIIIDIPINPENLIPTFVDALKNCDLDLVKRCVAAGADARDSFTGQHIRDLNLEYLATPLRVVSKSDTCTAENKYNVTRYLLEQGARPWDMQFERSIVETAENSPPAHVLCQSACRVSYSICRPDFKRVKAMISRARDNGEASAILNSNHYYHPGGISRDATVVDLCCGIPTLRHRVKMLHILFGLPEMSSNGDLRQSIEILRNYAFCQGNPAYRALLKCRNWSRPIAFENNAARTSISRFFDNHHLVNLVLQSAQDNQLNLQHIDRVNQALKYDAVYCDQETLGGQDVAGDDDEEAVDDFEIQEFDPPAVQTTYCSHLSDAVIQKANTLRRQNREAQIKRIQKADRLHRQNRAAQIERACCCFYCGTTPERCQNIANIALALWIAFCAAWVVMIFAGVFGHAK